METMAGVMKGAQTMEYRSMDDVPLVISVPEFARIIGVSRNTAYEIVRSGAIHSVRAGAQYRITKDALREYLRAA